MLRELTRSGAAWRRGTKAESAPSGWEELLRARRQFSQRHWLTGAACQLFDARRSLSVTAPVSVRHRRRISGQPGRPGWRSASLRSALERCQDVPGMVGGEGGAVNLAHPTQLIAVQRATHHPELTE